MEIILQKIAKNSKFVHQPTDTINLFGAFISLVRGFFFSKYLIMIGQYLMHKSFFLKQKKCALVVFALTSKNEIHWNS